ncbi:MAG: hypothetical protein HOQ30_09335 [Gemmatimonadaceae bacterium]|nr:hypothetical protein [Gemmatimonadaceae bacterium]NUQ93718.1 hypothetical protein [Gemmatimonadaceae bacterium]NUR34200.1 hypothetical protein [Gemmatimonadaceae bacterium]
MTRRGFALPAVLWVIVGVSAISLAGTLAARESVATAQNRVDHTRAAWRAEGCLEIARAAIADGTMAQAMIPIVGGQRILYLTQAALNPGAFGLRNTFREILSHEGGHLLYPDVVHAKGTSSANPQNDPIYALSNSCR